MLIRLYGQVYDSKRSNRKCTLPGGQLHCTGGLATNRSRKKTRRLLCCTVASMSQVPRLPASAMSGYFHGLPPQAKERYLEKLRLLEVEDPYSSEEKFVDGMTLWPPVEFGNIFCFFLSNARAYIPNSS